MTDDATSRMLRRLEITAALWCLAMTGAALVIARDRIAAAIGVLAGGLLVGVSYAALKGGVDGIVAMVGSTRDDRRSPRLALIAAKLAGRYALLAVLAYVMIARLRLPPLALMAGASSVVAAAVLEAGRLLLKTKR